MSDTRAAHRYALAIIDVAQEIKQLDEINRDFRLIEKLIGEVREFLVFLRSPVVNEMKKKRVLVEVLKGKVSDLMLKFIMLLATKDREGLLPDIIREFNRLRDERMGVLDVTAKTAVKFSSAQEQELVRKLAAATKKQIRVKYFVDPSLKGGFTVQFDDTVWDASVEHQLELLEQKFIEGIA